MSQAISSASQDANVGEVVVTAEEALIAPASFAQQRLWFLHQLEPDSSAYNIAGAVRMEGRLDTAALARCFDELVSRHETLRTNFITVEEEPSQLIAPPRPFSLARVDLRDFPEQERETEARRRMEMLAERPFNLEKDELLRAALFTLGEEEHVLLLVMDHIISDGWSLGVLVRELMALYEAFSEGRPSPLHELEIQYLDYAEWQRNWLTGKVLEDQLSYWRRQLGGKLPVLELPSEQPRRTASTSHGASEPLRLSRELSTALSDLSRRQGATLYMTLLAAFQTLLHRYTGLEDVCTGTPVAGRVRPETQNLVGFFVNTLVMRTDLSGDPSFEELLGRVRQTALDAHAHQDVPFEMLVEQLRPERSMSHTPLFQVMFALQNAPLPSMRLPGLRVSPLEIESPTAKFDLTLSMQETADGITGTMQYRTDLLTPEKGRLLARHFERLLQGIADNPRARISELPLMSGEELRLLLVQYNDTARQYPQDKCLHQLFEAQVASTPDAVALIFEDQQLSYSELNRRANQLANHLRSLGVGPDSSVGVLIERSTELVVSLLAVLKAGGAYVPFDPSYPSERLSFMLDDADCPVLLTQRRLSDSLPSGRGRVLCVDEPTAFEGFDAEDPAPVATPDNLAYVIYTSGSTGRPKGAMNTHRAICNRLLWMQEAYGLTPDDRVVQKTPFSFDVSVWEFFWPLMTGATLVVARPEGHKDSTYLVDLILERRITTLHFVPSMLQVFLEEPRVALCESLRVVICSGEALPYELQQRFFARSVAELHNLYGPTEAAVDVTSWACRRDSELPIVPIGRPIANIQTYVLDRHHKPVPAGVAGELHLGGVGLARGYLNRPDLTAERFIPDPFSTEPGGRLYRTGDLARHLSGGELEYLGRIDNQVKIRGFRIELGEIEAALAAHDSVRECVVVVREEGGDKRLAAYVVCEGEKVAEVAELRAHLRGRLPEYMIPAAFVMLDVLPLSPNGKVDRKALPETGAGQADARREYVEPRTPTEMALAQMWVEILRVERVGAEDNFFDLGGHSLLATRVITRVNEKYERKLPLRALFEKPTVAEFAALIEQGEGQEQERPAGLIQPRPRGRKNLAQLMEKLEQLQDSEATKILTEKRALRQQGSK
jgi:amino acid adenylation domain-containing protein